MESLTSSPWSGMTIVYEHRCIGRDYRVVGGVLNYRMRQSFWFVLRMFPLSPLISLMHLTALCAGNDDLLKR